MELYLDEWLLRRTDHTAFRIKIAEFSSVVLSRCVEELAKTMICVPEQLLADLGERVIGPAAAKVRELRGNGVMAIVPRCLHNIRFHDTRPRRLPWGWSAGQRRDTGGGFTQILRLQRR